MTHIGWHFYLFRARVDLYLDDSMLNDDPSMRYIIPIHPKYQSFLLD